MTTKVNLPNTTDSAQKAILEQEKLVLQYLLQSSDLKLLVAGVKHRLEEEQYSDTRHGLNIRNMEQV